MPKKVPPRKPSKGRSPDAVSRLLASFRCPDFFQPGRRIGVAVSGGADSVALLFLLLEVREKWGIVLSVAHFNHQLRGRASDADEKFVAALAAAHHLPFFVDRENISRKAKREQANLEETARRARYAFFDRLVSEGKFDKIAVAHTADDQAETVLAHIFRGTGLAGLGGIHPEAGAVFRPLLGLRRAELRAYLRNRRQIWREDASNRDCKRTRARIRLQLMPLLEKKFQPAVVDHLCQLADLAREDDAWLDSSAQLRLFLDAREENRAWRVSLADLFRPIARPQQPGSRDDLWSRQALAAMSKRMIRLLVKRVKPRAGQLSSVHVDSVLRLALQPDAGKSLPLPGGVEVRRERNSLCFSPMTPESSGSSKSIREPSARTVDLHSGEAEVPLVEHSSVLRFRVIDWPPQGRETKVAGAVLDRDRLRVPLIVRNWRPGDLVHPLGHQNRHRMSRLLNQLGVSRWEKVTWPVLTSGGEIAWTRGLPVAAKFAVDGSTRQGVVITEVPLA